jgi:HK97 family phage major capsid protein
MTLKDLLEKRAAAVGRLRAINDSPEGSDGDLSEAQSKEFSELRADLEKVDERIGRQRLIDEADRQAAGQPIAGSADATFEQECRSFSLVNAIAAQIPGLDVDAGREIEISRELKKRNGANGEGFAVPMQVFHRPLEKRVISSTLPAGGPGANIVATDHRADQFIDILRAALVINQLGARVLNDLTGNVDLPRLKASATLGWVAENAAITASDSEYDKVSLSPKHAGVLSEISRNMVQQTSPDIENLIRADMAALLARAIDGVAIQGGGTNEPTGILATAGVGEVEAGDPDGGAVDLDLTADLIGTVDDANVNGRRAFLTNSKVKRVGMKLKDADNRPLTLPTLFHQEPVSFSNLVPNDLTKGAGTNLNAVIYGDWTDLIIGYWSQFDLLVNPFESTAYSKGNVMIRAMITADVALRHVASFAFADDVTS